MARKIRYIAPVESMSGNLSGDQVLEYTSGTKVWDSPGTDISATNYNTRYIAARRTATGASYFSVRQRATAANTQANRMAMAQFGGSASATSYIMRDAEHLPQLRSLWVSYKQATGTRKTFREFIFDQVYKQLGDKAQTIQITDSSTGGVQYKNPWVTGGAGSDIVIPAEIVNKFRLYLGA